jgi:hypothetical protein
VTAVFRIPLAALRRGWQLWAATRAGRIGIV